MVILHALGQCLIRTGVATIGSRAELSFALATRLIADRGRRLTRRHLTALFWPDASEQKAAHSLSEALHKLRARGIPIEGDAAHNVWIPRDAATTDVDRIPEIAPAELVKCDFTILPDFEPPGSAALLDWADEFRHQLKVRAARNLRVAITHAERAGDWASAMALAEHALQLDAADLDALDARVRAASALRAGRASQVVAAPRQASDARAVREAAPAGCPLPTATPAPGQGPLIGRGAELEILHHAWDRARNARGSRIAVLGAAGSGKSLLIRQLFGVARRTGGVVADVAAEPGDTQRPLSAFIRLVPKLRLLPGAAGCAPDAAPYLDALTAHDPASSLWPDPTDVPHMVTCVQRAIDDLVAAVADEQPLLIAIDNAQWMDADSARMIEALTLAIGSRAVLLVLASCDTCAPADADACLAAVPLPLGPLPDADARALVLDHIERSGREAEEALVEWFVRAGEGNPLQIEELVNHWLATGISFTLPPTLAALLQSRVAALSATERRTLQIVALLGQQATLARAERVASLGRDTFLATLDALGRAGLLCVDEAAADSSVRLACRHDALADAALAQLSPPARALLHREIAAVLDVGALDPRCADLRWDRAEHQTACDEGRDPVEITVNCARHLAAIGLTDAGVIACRQLLEQNLSHPARVEAMTALARTLHLGRRWHELRETVALIDELRDGEAVHDDVELCLLDARWKTGEDWVATIDAAARCAAERSATVSHRLRAAAVAIKLATDTGCAALLDKVFASVEDALAAPSADPADRAYVEMMYHAVNGEPPLAADAARRLTSASEHLPDPSRLRAILNSATAIARTGALADALGLFDAVAMEAGRKGMTNLAASACHRATTACLNRGEIDTAPVWLQRHEMYAAADDLDQRSLTRLAAARLAFHAGEFHAAETTLKLGGRPLWEDALPSFAATALATAIATGCALQREAEVIASLLEQLTPLHERLKGMGAHDFVAYALAAGNEYVGRPRHAAAVLDAYLTQHRRDPFPVPGCFAAMVGQLAV